MNKRRLRAKDILPREHILSLNYNSTIVAEVRFLGISAVSGIGVSQLRIGIEFSIPPWQAKDGSAIVRDLRAEIFAGPSRNALAILGFAVPEVPLILEPKQFPQKTPILFLLNLSDQQICNLEEVRCGGDLHFRIVLTGASSGQYGNYSAHEEIHADYSLSEWARVLSDLRYKDTLVIGIELPIGEIGERMSSARDNLRQAHNDLILGRYDDVVSRCRKVLESLQAALNEKEAAAAAMEKYTKGPRRHMSKQERELVVAEAARHYAHPAHHVDNEGVSEWYSRDDATFILAIAVAVFKGAAARQSSERTGTAPPG